MALGKRIYLRDHTSMLRCRDRLPCDAGKRGPTTPRVLRLAERIRGPDSNRLWHPTKDPQERVSGPQAVGRYMRHLQL